MGIRSSVLALLLAVAGCTQGHCRRKVEASEVSPPPAVADLVGKPSAQDRIFIYKYDGSLQCGMGKPLAVEVMAKELQGIQIFSSEKKSDGLMHIQVCGSVTGLANVYEVTASAQKKAESKGFKKWTFE